jgi:hypothetical protein
VRQRQGLHHAKKYCGLVVVPHQCNIQVDSTIVDPKKPHSPRVTGGAIGCRYTRAGIWPSD